MPVATDTYGLNGCHCVLCRSALFYGYRWRGVLANVMWVSADEGGDEIYTFSVRLDSLRNLGVSLTAFCLM